MFHKRNILEAFLGAIIMRLPYWLMKIFQSIAFRGTKKLKAFRETANRIAADIIERETKASRGELPKGKDIMSSLGMFIL